MLMIHVWPMAFSGKMWSREGEVAQDPKVWLDEFCSLSCKNDSSLGDYIMNIALK